MKLSLINKYQPKNLWDFELDTELKILIQTLIQIDNLNILLLGDAGCGKSSLIKAIINEYYKDSDDKNIANNVLSINSLKEQGISYYRTEVKTFCQTTSSIINKKKFLILDDIDIINEQSQQVFRNCIDKYSSNVHFIASCINLQKVIESLQSRVYILKLQAFDRPKLTRIMERICANEKIVICKEAKDFILTISNNSIRILINYLEKLKLLDEPIDMEYAQLVCTNIVYSDFVKYSEYCLNAKDMEVEVDAGVEAGVAKDMSASSLKNALNIINEIYNKGYSVMDILDNYFQFIKSTDIFTEEQKYKIIKLICSYITIFHTIHEHEIELALFTNNLINICAST